MSPKAWCQLYKLTGCKNPEIFWKLLAVKSWKPIGHEVLVSNQDWPRCYWSKWQVVEEEEKKLMSHYPPRWPGPPHYRGFTITLRHIILWPSYQPCSETSTWKHKTLTTDIHAAGRIRTHNLSRRAAADLRLRPRGHWDRQLVTLLTDILTANWPVSAKCPILRPTASFKPVREFQSALYSYFDMLPNLAFHNELNYIFVSYWLNNPRRWLFGMHTEQSSI